MGTTLTGTTPQDTYDSLIKVTDNGPLSGTAKYLSDGLGNDSALALSTSAVGVSETSPLGKLHVKTADTSVSSVSAQGNLLVLEDTENGLSILSSTAGAGYILFGDSADNDVAGIVYDHSVNAMIFNTNAAERLRITSAGNVGIGTSSPAATLEVKGGTSGFRAITSGATTATFSFLTDLGLGYDNALQIVAGQESSNNAYAAFNTKTAGSVTEKVRITSGGYLRLAAGGIQFNGDTAAANALDDYEEGTWTMGVSFGGASTGVTFANNTGTYTKIGRQVTVTGYANLTSKGSATGAAAITGLPFTIANTLSAYPSLSVHLDKVTFANQYSGYGVGGTTTAELREVTEAGVGTALTNADFANDSSWVISLTYFV